MPPMWMRCIGQLWQVWHAGRHCIGRDRRNGRNTRYLACQDMGLSVGSGRVNSGVRSTWETQEDKKYFVFKFGREWMLTFDRFALMDRRWRVYMNQHPHWFLSPDLQSGSRWLLASFLIWSSVFAVLSCVIDVYTVNYWHIHSACEREPTLHIGAGPRLYTDKLYINPSLN